MVFGVSGDITSQEEWRDRMFLWDRLYWQTKRETLADIIQQVEPTMQGILILSIQVDTEQVDLETDQIWPESILFIIIFDTRKNIEPIGG